MLLIFFFNYGKKTHEESACSARDTEDVGSIPGSGRFPGVGNGNPLQYSCLENSMGRGAWQAIAHGAAETQLSEHAQKNKNYYHNHFQVYGSVC